MSDLDMLLDYGRRLVAAGFEVWHTQSGTRSPGYLQYRDPETGCWGSLQYSLSSYRWHHLMPLVPSKEYGSSMFIERPAPAFTVEAARQCAREFNRNSVVGTRSNAKGRTWVSKSAVPLHVVQP